MKGNSKILYITSFYPHPPNSGGQIRSLNLLKYLSTQGEVTMISPASDGYAENRGEALQALQDYCGKIQVIDPTEFGPHSSYFKKPGLSKRLRHFLRGEAWVLQDFISERFRNLLRDQNPQQFDTIVLRYPMLAYYFYQDPILRTCLSKVVVDVDDILPVMQERHLMTLSFGRKKFRHWLELQFIRAFYQKLGRVRACLVCSERDKKYLEDRSISKRVYVIPNTVEINGIHGGGSRTNRNPKEILFCGALSFSPNVEALRYFVHSIFPKIQAAVPGVHLTVVGKAPGEKVRAMGKYPGIDVVGTVPSTIPYYQRAAITVVPLLNGAGTRIKILEAMAHSIPVVSSSVGAEGLDVTHGDDIFIADEPELFADECIRLLSDPSLRTAMAQKGYELVRRKYDREALYRSLDTVVGAMRISTC